MKKQARIVLIFLVVLLSLSLGISFVFANSYPERPITMINPFSAGGSISVMCRTLAPYLSKELGVDILVENHSGAGSQIGLSYLLNSKPDGYTLSEISQPHASFTITTQDAPYVLDDFAILGIQQIDPTAVNVMNEKPWQDLRELFDYIKENPGEIAIGCTQASGQHIILLWLQENYGLDFIIVPYAGGGDGRTALIGGHVDVYVAQAFANRSLKGQAKCLAVGWDERSEIWPDAPTFQELFNDDELTNLVKSTASIRGFAFPKKFREEYPDRWEVFLKAYVAAYNNEGHWQDSEKVGQTSVMLELMGPEEAEKLVKSTQLIVEEYSHYFK